MAIKRIGNTIVFQCDECGDELETQKVAFDEALTELRETGWTSTRRLRGGWVHRCFQCAEDNELGRERK